MASSHRIKESYNANSLQRVMMNGRALETLWTWTLILIKRGLKVLRVFNQAEATKALSRTGVKKMKGKVVRYSLIEEKVKMIKIP